MPTACHHPWRSRQEDHKGAGIMEESSSRGMFMFTFITKEKKIQDSVSHHIFQQAKTFKLG
jgi:hypothetical protein